MRNFNLFMFINQIYIFLAVVNVVHVDANLTCLSCKDSPIPRDCQYTTICGSHEVCYTNSYVTTVGSLRHELGCMDISQCPIVKTNTRSADNLLVCSNCCNGTLCNSGLCGQTGIPPLTAGSRGPICYSCDQQLTPDTCHVIKECGRDEECMLMRFESQVGHDTLYKSDCVKKSECAENLQRYQSGQMSGSLLIGRRAVKERRNEHCAFKCCSTDLCNSDCSGSRVSHTAVGHITAPTTSVVQTTHPSDTCTDSRNDCTIYRQYCNMDWGLANCRKSCGLCSVALTDPCIDRTICSHRLQSCNTDWGRQYCIRSCNRCSEISYGQNQTQQSGSGNCQTPDPWPARDCERYKTYCSDPNNYIKDLCRHYCGYCST